MKEEELRKQLEDIQKPIYEKQMELVEVINEALGKMMDLGARIARESSNK